MYSGVFYFNNDEQHTALTFTNFAFQTSYTIEPTEYNDFNSTSWTYKPKKELPFNFNGCLDMRNMDTRLQLYIRSKAKINIGNHCGFLDCVSGNSKVFQVQRVFPLNQNVIDEEVYANNDNINYVLEDDYFKVDILRNLPDKTESKTQFTIDCCQHFGKLFFNRSPKFIF